MANIIHKNYDITSYALLSWNIWHSIFSFQAFLFILCAIIIMIPSYIFLFHIFSFTSMFTQSTRFPGICIHIVNSCSHVQKNSSRDSFDASKKDFPRVLCCREWCRGDRSHIVNFVCASMQSTIIFFYTRTDTPTPLFYIFLTRTCESMNSPCCSLSVPISHRKVPNTGILLSDKVFFDWIFSSNKRKWKMEKSWQFFPRIASGIVMAIW